MEQIKVSVIIPVYNAQKYLKICLDSVINQTLKDLQIICVNDGSTDESLSIINEYAAKDGRILVIDQNNAGLGAAYNNGMKAAKGEFIGFVEPDDFIAEDMFENLYITAKNNNVDFIKSDFFEIKSDGEKKYKNLTYSKEYYNHIINPQEDINVFNFAMNVWTGIYKREFLQKYGITYNETPGASFQDNGFWFKTFCFATRVYFLNKAFYNYKIDNPASSVNNPDKVYAMKTEYDLIYEFLNKNPKLKEKFKYIYRQRKFKNLKFSYKRISDKYKMKFLSTFSKDIKDAEKSGEIDKTLFRKDELREIFFIKNIPLIYYLLHR